MCDATMPSAYSERHVTARLVHTCYSCGFPIVRGEVYNYASGVWDGRPDHFRRHELCALLDRLAAGGDGCWEFGGLQDARDRDDLPWVFRRAWETVTRREWADCDGCGQPLNARRECLWCTSDDVAVASW